jgi:hypothetical protein
LRRKGDAVRRLCHAWVLALGGGLLAGGCERPPPVDETPAPTGPPILHGTDSPQVILDRVIAAHGGEKGLARWKCGRVKYLTRSDIIPLLEEKPRSIEEFFELPGKLKRITVVGQGRRQTVVTFVVDGSQGWEYLPDGTTKLLPPEALAASLRTVHAFSDFGSLYRLRNPVFRLNVLGENTAAGRPVVVLHAESIYTNPIDYFFDRVSGLLIHSVRHLRSPSGSEKTIELDLKDYHDVGGTAVPFHVVGRSEGKILLEFTIREVEFVDHFDASTFAPP